MVNAPIVPILLSQIGQAAPVSPASPAGGAGAVAVPAGEDIFDKVLSRAIDALNSVSESEMHANKLIDDYVAGKAELSDVMLATSKMTIAVNLAVTTITTAVSSFKEITQIPI